MFELAGQLDRVELDFTLWVVVAAPWIGTLLCLRAAQSAGEQRKAAEALARNVALIASALSVAVTLYALGSLLLSSAKPQLLICHLWTLARISSVSIELSLVLDTASGAALLASTLAVLGFAVHERKGADMRRLGAVLAVAGAVQLSILADDVVMAIAGWAIAHTALALLAAATLRGKVARGAGFAAQRMTELMALAAAGVVFWGLSGSWAPGGDFLVDFRPRLVGVQDPDALPKAAKKTRLPRDANGRIEMLSLSGSRVKVGTAQLCERDAEGRHGGIGIPSRPCKKQARAPFVGLEFPAALHDLTVFTGPGSYDLSAEKVRIYPNVRTSIVATGPTLSSRATTDQMRLRDSSGSYVHRAGLSARRLGGLYATSWVSALLLLSILGFALSSPRDDERSDTLAAGISVLLPLAGAVFIHRFEYVFAMNETAAAWVALIAGVSCAGFAAHAGFARSSRGVFAGAASAALLATLVGVAAGAGARAVLLAVVTALGLCALLLATGAWTITKASRGVDRRAAYLAAAVASGAPVPFLGAFFGRDALLRAGAGMQGSAIPGFVIAGVAAIGLGLVAFAVWRMAFAACQSASGSKPSSRSAWSWALSVVGIVLGGLAISGPLIGTPPTWLAALFRMPAVEAPSMRLLGDVQLTWVGVGFLPALVGFFLARRRYVGDEFVASESKRPLHGLFVHEPEKAPLNPAFAGVGAAINRFEEAVFAASAQPVDQARAGSEDAPAETEAPQSDDAPASATASDPDLEAPPAQSKKRPKKKNRKRKP